MKNLLSILFLISIPFMMLGQNEVPLDAAEICPILLGGILNA